MTLHRENDPCNDTLAAIITWMKLVMTSSTSLFFFFVLLFANAENCSRGKLSSRWVVLGVSLGVAYRKSRLLVRKSRRIVDSARVRLRDVTYVVTRASVAFCTVCTYYARACRCAAIGFAFSRIPPAIFSWVTARDSRHSRSAASRSLRSVPASS